MAFQNTAYTTYYYYTVFLHHVWHNFLIRFFTHPHSSFEVVSSMLASVVLPPKWIASGRNHARMLVEAWYAKPRPEAWGAMLTERTSVHWLLRGRAAGIIRWPFVGSTVVVFPPLILVMMSFTTSRCWFHSGNVSSRDGASRTPKLLILKERERTHRGAPRGAHREGHTERGTPRGAPRGAHREGHREGHTERGAERGTDRGTRKHGETEKRRLVASNPGHEEKTIGGPIKPQRRE